MGRDGADQSRAPERPNASRTMSNGSGHLDGPSGSTRGPPVPFGRPTSKKAKDIAASKSQNSSDMDLLPRVKGMYRLLELFAEQGSGGVVDKIIISQDSVSDLVEEFCPGAYSSLTKIDFTALDSIILQPIGVYGSLPSLGDFMEDLGAVDSATKALLLAPPNEAGRPQPYLKTGIYFIPDSAGHLSKARGGYVIYWPEYTTWDDDATSTVKRNRVTFMRYLTKLSDQVLSLMSKAHSDAILWNEEQDEKSPTEKKKPAAHSRLYTFAVQKTKEQEESVSMHDGFKTAVPLFSDSSFAPEDAHLAPRVVPGETRQAIISGENIAERVIEQNIRRTATKVALAAQIKDPNLTIRLGDSLNIDGANHLFEIGLRSRHKKISDAWKKELSDLRVAQEEALTRERHDARRGLDADLPRLKAHIKDQIVQRVVRMYPFIQGRLPVNADAQDSAEPPARGQATHKLPMLTNDIFSRAALDQITSPVYQQLKNRLVVATEAIQTHDLSPDAFATLDEAVLTGRGYNELIKQYLGLGSPNAEDSATLLGALYTTAKVWTVGGSDESELIIQSHLRKASRLPDPNVLHMVERDDWISRLPRTGSEMLSLAAGWILEKLDVQSNTYSHRVSDEQFRDGEALYRAKVDSTFKGMAEARLQKMKEDVNKAEVTNSSSSRVWKIHALTETRNAWGVGNGKNFNVVETAQFTEPAHVLYTIHTIDLSQGDTQAINADNTHLPKPVIRPNAKWSFQVPLTSSLRHIQLFANGRSLIVIDDHSAGKAKVFLDDDNFLPQAISQQKMKKLFDLPRIGDDYLFSVNESKRLVAIFSKSTSRLYTYAIDEHFMSLQSRSADIDLRRWLNAGEESDIQILTITFLVGSEELALVDNSGTARIFSLVTEQFRPASLKLPFVPDRTVSSPDGTCLYFFDNVDDSGTLNVRAYHSASFGTNAEGTEFVLPSFEWAGGSMTSFVSRSNPYLVTWSMEHTQLISKRFHIKNRISEFSFKAQDRPRQRNGGKHTRHNSLLDVHAEIWTKFPVSSTIERSSPASQREPPLLQFITDSPDKPFVDYFNKLIQQFEKGTQKPTDGKLEAIQLDATSHRALRDEGHGFEVTSYPVGKWLVELLCLIPIHLAITAGNRFIPLANGVTSAEFERSLLGADVMQIANSITLGWYESIFASYMATKPVKVVSSMGEQSVGKSYALNHFVDTSFAGSAMRCTEGAWLSVTPTDDELIVALDFEGIHSIERSAQEDMLLVLLNVAVSNLVLFRNNFALSRDLAGLFTSFQSSTSLINPEQNPNLFRSILCIIIKDVTDGDADEIVGEFFGKFQKIVQDEQEGNFITKLHRGQLDILPWPVIQSKEFYDLMGLLKERLDNQESSHGNASMFLATLKTLMAKLKASDWGALDHNLASYRAQTLQGVLVNALIFGITENDASDGQLRNLDTNEVIEHENTNSAFWLSVRDETNPYARRDALQRLRVGWITDLERQQTPEADYVLALAAHLQGLVTTRILHVGAWIDSNVSRFSSEHADIQNLRRQFETLSRELAAGVEICAMKCSSCGLRCVEGKRHDGEHDCGTTHRCIHQCALDKERGCGFNAGHQGNHICDVKLHLCGEPCSLGSKQGCQGSCVQSVGHKEGEHLCDAESHACGKPCHLNSISRDGVALCSLPCTIDCRTKHDRHSCENRLTCPVKCQLCPRLCATADHSHVLQNGAVHLCGQEHACEELCASPGICHVATEPRSVESTFVGKNERFQFTKYTQVANRLACVHRIPKNKLRHDGPHTHSARKDVFHFCETRCPYCQYVCSLPLGHPQEHSTSHGSMEQTTWALDGGDDATREIQGRKFSAGDSGAPMLCSMVCKELGRHAHIAYCRSARASDCTHREVQHINKRMAPEPSKPKDWITHALYWARSGFKDPYAIEEQTEFAKCDSECAGDEHKAHDEVPARPSYCTLPMFHAPVEAGPRAVGYVSTDGHVFDCRNPAVVKAAFHVVFIVDRSGSMMATHCRPLAGTPVTGRITASQNNCYGAVLSALYGFWSARETAAAHSGTIRRDAYSIILEGTAPETVLDNDFTMTADELLTRILNVSLAHNNDFAGSIREAQRLIEKNWSTERTPVVIFLSDGIWSLPSAEMNNLCRRAVTRGKPLPFHSVFFGSRDSTPSVLAQMSDIARGIYSSAKRDRESDSPANACTYTNAINTIQLSQTFLGLAESMRQTRSSLIRS